MHRCRLDFNDLLRIHVLYRFRRLALAAQSHRVPRGSAGWKHQRQKGDHLVDALLTLEAWTLRFEWIFMDLH